MRLLKNQYYISKFQEKIDRLKDCEGDYYPFRKTKDGQDVYLDVENVVLWTKTSFPNMSDANLKRFLFLVDKV